MTTVPRKRILPRRHPGGLALVCPLRAAGLGLAPAAVIPVSGPGTVVPKPAARSRAVERPIPAGATDGGPSRRLSTQPPAGSVA
jgi:hypothetical protein